MKTTQGGPSVRPTRDGLRQLLGEAGELGPAASERRPRLPNQNRRSDFAAVKSEPENTGHVTEFIGIRPRQPEVPRLRLQERLRHAGQGSDTLQYRSSLTPATVQVAVEPLGQNGT